jgi:hypothetical protein
MASDPFQGVYSAELMGGMYGPNKYSQFNNAPLPLPGYVGTPTDAMGNPIQPPPGTTLNTPPPAAAPPPAAGPGNQQQWAYNNAMLNSMGNNLQPQGLGGPSQGWRGGAGEGSIAGSQLGDIVGMRQRNNAMYGIGPQGGNWGQVGPVDYSQAGGQAGGQAGSQAGGQAGGAGSLNDALALLSNPGKVTTPGATVPEAPSLGQQTPSVLQSFLASRGGGTGAGNYTNAPFFATLNALKGSR